jgi:hypothetical protein
MPATRILTMKSPPPPRALPTQCVYGFRMISTINSYYFLKLRRFFSSFPSRRSGFGPLLKSCGICGGQRRAGVGFTQLLPFPLPILIPPAASYSSTLYSLGLTSSLNSEPETAPEGRSRLGLVKESQCFLKRRN